MKELDAKQLYFLEQAWIELNKAESLCKVNRIAKAQEALSEALFIANQLPRWYSNEEWKEKFQKLHRKIYTGV